jgi:hypothetical protein
VYSNLLRDEALAHHLEKQEPHGTELCFSKTTLFRLLDVLGKILKGGDLEAELAILADDAGSFQVPETTVVERGGGEWTPIHLDRSA